MRVQSVTEDMEKKQLSNAICSGCELTALYLHMGIKEMLICACIVYFVFEFTPNYTENVCS